MRALAAILTITLLVGCGKQQEDWEGAQSEGTIDAYEWFVETYPTGERAEQARAALAVLYEERDWQTARAAHSVESYRQFLSTYTDSAHDEDATFFATLLAAVADKAAQEPKHELVESYATYDGVNENGLFQFSIKGPQRRCCCFIRGAMPEGTAIGFSAAPQSLLVELPANLAAGAQVELYTLCGRMNRILGSAARPAAERGAAAQENP